MQPNLGTVVQWLTFVSLIIGVLTLFVRIGNTQGRQDEKNKVFESTLKTHGIQIDTIKDDLTDIKEDVSFIKGKFEVKT